MQKFERKKTLFQMEMLHTQIIFPISFDVKKAADAKESGLSAFCRKKFGRGMEQSWIFFEYDIL